MTTPPKYEELVLKVAELERRETALREELSRLADDCCEKVDDILDLQQRLTVAEQRSKKFELLLLDVSGRGRVVRWEIGLMDQIDDVLGHDGFCEQCCGSGWANQGCVDLCTSCGGTGMAALKPAAEPRKCIECESQYCHGVCVERGDDDERYKGAEGEGS